MTTKGTLRHIFRHPLKSALGESLERTDIAETGVDGDRAYALIDVATRKVVSAKRPKLWRSMLCIAASRMPDGEGVSITFPDGRVLDQRSDDFVATLSAFLGRDVELAEMRHSSMRLERARPDEVAVEGLDADVTLDINALAEATPGRGFQDFAPLHLISMSTMRAIADSAGLGDLDMARYRPNLVVEMQDAQAFCEDGWLGREVTIGSVRLHVMQLTPRCAIPTLALGRGDHFRPEILQAINKLNRVEVEGFGKLPCAGVYARVLKPGAVKIGDAVDVRM
jgi:uncharacterized protein YcbX